MNNHLKRVRQIERKTKIFVPGFVLESIRKYLLAREEERLRVPGFREKLSRFFSEYPKALGTITELRESEFYRLFDSSNELKESYLLAIIADVCDVAPSGSWMESSNPCVYKHYYRLSVEFFHQASKAPWTVSGWNYESV